MSSPLDTVVKQLEDSGIIAAGKLENFIPPKAHPKDVGELVAELVKQNHLTKFQAAQVTAGRAKSLLLGGYTILDMIGAGGMGQVFKAEHRRMKRVVAIKTLPAGTMKDPAAVARFQREVEAAAKLRHTNIVAADDADEAAGVHFLVMEYVEGQDLSSLVKKTGPLDVDRAVRYLLHAARGLEYAHGEGVIHRDIKPANLLVDKKGTVKILDMGLARIETGDVGAQAELTGTGAVMGTVDYMAPEQALSTKHADARADIYSLGCTLHYLLTGRPPFSGETLMARLLAHRDEPIPSLAAANPNVPDALELIFQKLLAKRVEDRYQSMTELIADLERLTGAGSSTSSNTSGAPQVSNPIDSGLVTFLKDLPQQPTKKSVGAKPDRPLAAGLDPSRPAAPQTPDARRQAPRPNKKRAAMIAGGTLACAAVIAGLISTLKRPSVEPIAVVPATPVVTKSAPVVAANLALDFNGKSYVRTPIVLADDAPFTVEAWVTARGNKGTIASDESSGGFFLDISDDNTWQFGCTLTVTPLRTPTGIARLENLSQRRHVAGVFDGSEVRFYVDGVSFGSRPCNRFKASKFPLAIGCNPARSMGGGTTYGALAKLFDGTIDEVRISKVARYTTDFTPQLRHEPDADTLALYHFDEGSGTIANDSSGNSQHATIVAAKWVGGNGAFGPVTSTVAGGSALEFDGSDSYAAAPLDFDGNPPLTIEGWITPLRSDRKAIYVISVGEGGESRCAIKYDVIDWHGIISGTNAWQADRVSIPNATGKRDHVAITWDGEYIRCFVNGHAKPGRGLKLQADLAALRHQGGLKIGFGESSAVIDEVRISKTIRYTDNFTPQPRFEPDADTLALYHFDEGAGTTARDASGNRHDATIIGAKWVPSASPLDGLPEAKTSDGFALDPSKNPDVTKPASIELARVLTPGDPFTVEMVVTPRSVPGVDVHHALWSFSGILELKQHNDRWVWQRNNRQADPKIEQVSVPIGPLNRPTYLAAVSTGSQLRLFVDGKLAGTRDLVNVLPQTKGLGMSLVHSGGDAANYTPLDGTVDEIRISKTVRYTADYVPQPTLTADADTLMLFHCDEGTGTALVDSSGNRHDGTLRVPIWISAGSPSGNSPGN